jgi:molybdate transport system substrate-binding protein
MMPDSRNGAARNSSPALRILSSGAMREIVLGAGELYERRTGTQLLCEFTRSPLVRDRVRGGEAVDVAVTTHPRIEELARDGKVVPGSTAVLARSGIGVAVRAGQSKPDISSVAAFVATMRAAKSVACADPAFGTASGLYLVELFERLGLTAEMRRKAHLVAAQEGMPIVVCAAVADGTAELGIQQIAEIVAVPGVELAGPLPAAIQHTTVFGAGVVAAAPNPGLARAFVTFLSGDDARPVIAAHGMEPP